MKSPPLVVVLCLVVLLGGCAKEKPEKGAGQRREQVYTDKTPQEWLELIQHRDFRVRTLAVDALIQYRKDGQDSVSSLIEILEAGKSGQVRLSVAKALGGMGTDAKAAVPALCEALADHGWKERDAAAEALGAIRAARDQTIAALAAALSEDTDERVRGKAAEALGRLRPGDRKVVAALAAALEDEDEDQNVRAYAAEALGQIGPKAKAAASALEKAARSEYFIVADAAKRALQQIRP